MNLDFDNDNENDGLAFNDIFGPDVISLLGSMVYESLSNGYPISFAVTRKKSLQCSLLSPEGKSKKFYCEDEDELQEKAIKIFGLGGEGEEPVKRATSRSKR